MRKRVLLVKTSSLATSCTRCPPSATFKRTGLRKPVDWVVEEAYASIPRLHKAVANVLLVAVRRWRELRAHRYDAIIDSQGLYKSAVIALAAHGPRYGLGWHSARERVAPFYQQTFPMPWSLHAVERNRLLVARALGYEVPARCDYGITSAPRRYDWLTANRYAVLLHSTSRDHKLWPEARWIELTSALNERGMCCVLPWGNAIERERAARIAGSVRSAVVAPPMDLAEFPPLFAGAQAVVGVDTGLTHLAAALGTPTVGIYLGTNPGATGLYGCARAQNLGGIDSIPDTAEVVGALSGLWYGPMRVSA